MIPSFISLFADLVNQQTRNDGNNKEKKHFKCMTDNTMRKVRSKIIDSYTVIRYWSNRNPRRNHKENKNHKKHE